MAADLEFLCTCDSHLNHSICDDGCICIVSVKVARKHLLAGDFMEITTRVRLSEAER